MSALPGISVGAAFDEEPRWGFREQHGIGFVERMSWSRTWPSNAAGVWLAITSWALGVRARAPVFHLLPVMPGGGSWSPGSWRPVIGPVLPVWLPLETEGASLVEAVEPYV